MSNPFAKPKISLEELALKITQRNLEKQAEKEEKIKIKKSRKKKSKSNFAVIKVEGKLLYHIPESMHRKGFDRKLENNQEDINKFINSDDNLLKL